MGVLDVVRAEVQAFASGETGGPALGVLASCPRRLAYPNASFTLSEPRLRVGGHGPGAEGQPDDRLSVLPDRRGGRPGRGRHPRGRTTWSRADRRRGHRLRPDPRPCRQANVLTRGPPSRLLERARRREAGGKCAPRTLDVIVTSIVNDLC